MTVIGIGPDNICVSDMFVLIQWGGRKLAVPLLQLHPLTHDKETLEAVADWHYWVEHDYQF